MFDERRFVTQKQSHWQDLSIILERVKTQGLRSVPQTDLSRLGLLYRRTAADLAYARTQHATTELLFYLNELVGQGHGVLYQPSSGRSVWTSLFDFFRWDLPHTLRRRTPFTLLAFGLTVAGTLLAYFLVRHNPADAGLFVPAGLQSSVKSWEHGSADNGTISAGMGAMFSAYLMTHNIFVGLMAFATGLTVILPIFFMLQNGYMMGALIALVQPTGHLSTLWAGIAPHGVCELTAIFIAGGAGFLIAWSLVSPGRLTRRDALVANTKDAAKMVVGTVPLFIIAGIIEGNVSHSSLPHWVKFTLAGILFAMILFYIYGNWQTAPQDRTGPS